MIKQRKLYFLILVGHLVINLPIVLICFGLPTLLAFSIDKIFLRILAIGLGYIVGIITSWFLWSYLVTKWRLWAFNQVEEDDLIKLKEMAIANKLIWHDGTSFEQTEIRTKFENKKIESIAENIHELEQIEEIKLDLITPETYGYKLGKKENIAEAFSMIMILLVSIGTCFTDIYILGVIMFFYVLKDLKKIKYFPKSFVDENYLELSQEGIRIGFNKENIILWRDMERLTVDKELRQLTIKINEREDQINFELWRLESYNFNEFNKYIDVFVDRHKMRYFT